MWIRLARVVVALSGMRDGRRAETRGGRRVKRRLFNLAQRLPRMVAPHHVFAVAAWFVGAAIGWLGVCNALLVTILILQRRTGWGAPVWLNTGYSIFLSVGFLVVPLVVALMAIRHRLPGT